MGVDVDGIVYDDDDDDDDDDDVMIGFEWYASHDGEHDEEDVRHYS